MALSEAERLECFTILDIPATSNIFGRNQLPRQYAENALKTLTSAQIQKVRELLVRWDAVKFKSGQLTGRFAQTANEEKAVFRARLVNLIGFEPYDYVGDGGPRIERM